MIQTKFPNNESFFQSELRNPKNYLFIYQKNNIFCLYLLHFNFIKIFYLYSIIDLS